MNYASIGLILFVVCHGVLHGQEPALPGGGAAPGSSKVIVVEALIAEVSANEAGGEKVEEATVIKLIQELEKQGKLDRCTRLTLSILHGQTGKIQFGERVPLAVGQTNTRNGGPAQTNFNYQNVGTLLSVVAEVANDRIALACSFEQSGIARTKPAEENAGFEPRGLDTMTTQSSVSLKSGETIILTSRSVVAGGKTVSSYVLITATEKK